MKHILVLILVIFSSCTGLKKNESGIKIIPQPSSVKESGGFFKLENKATISSPDESTSSIITIFSNEVKDYQNFLIRLKPMLNWLKEKDIYYFDLYEPERNPEPAGPDN